MRSGRSGSRSGSAAQRTPARQQRHERHEKRSELFIGPPQAVNEQKGASSKYCLSANFAKESFRQPSREPCGIGLQRHRRLDRTLYPVWSIDVQNDLNKTHGGSNTSRRAFIARPRVRLEQRAHAGLTMLGSGRSATRAHPPESGWSRAAGKPSGARRGGRGPQFLAMPKLSGRDDYGAQDACSHGV